MRKQFVNTISKIMQNNSNAVLLLGDIGVYGFREVLSSYPDRAYNIGILEQSTISLSSGLSLCGLVPIVHTIAPFIVERALEQIKVDLCYQGLSANLVSVGGSYDYAALGPTHHCPADVPTLNEIPDIEIVVPGHPDEFDQIFTQSYDNGATTYYRLSESSNKDAYDVEFGKNIILREDGDVVVIAVGTVLQSVLDATSDLDITLVYCTTVKPFDLSSIKHFLRNKIIVVEPYYSSPIITNIMRESNEPLGRITSIGVPNNFINKYGKKEEIDTIVGLDSESIRGKVMERIFEEE
jgi:transketolase